jgi:hypothetical protein
MRNELIRAGNATADNKTAMKSLTKAVIASFLICIGYTVTAVVLAVRGVYLPDTLTQYFFITFGVEFAATASIKIAKSIISGRETDERIRRIKEENLEVDKKDIAPKDNDYTDYEGGQFYG